MSRDNGRLRVIYEFALFVKRLVGLRYDIFVFFVGCEVLHLVGNHAGFLLTRRYGASMKPYSFIFAYVLSEVISPIFCPSGVSNRAHSAIMRVVNVTNFKAGFCLVRS